jgi:hypothetical protein
MKFSVFVSVSCSGWSSGGGGGTAKQTAIRSVILQECVFCLHSLGLFEL